MDDETNPTPAQPDASPADKLDLDKRIEKAIEVVEGAAKRGLVTTDNVRDIVTNVVDDLMRDKPELVRKFTPGSARTDGDPSLDGTPYAGLDVQDMAFANALLNCRRQWKPGSKGPDDVLQSALAQLTRSATVGGRRIHNTITPEYGEEATGEQVLPLFEGAYLESTIMNAFDTVRMTEKKLRIPVPSKLPVAYVAGEATTDAGLSPASTRAGVKEIEIEPTKTMLTMVVSDELIEDGTLWPVLPFYTAQARRGIGYAMDEPVIRGDATTDTHNINNEGAAIPTVGDDDQLPAYTAFDGLHHSFLVDNTDNLLDGVGGISAKDVLKLRPLMTDSDMKQAWGFAGDARDRFLLTDYSVANYLLTLEEVMTVDKMGALATLLTGQLGALYGMPILTSPCLALYNDTGIYDAADTSNNTGSTLAMVNKRGFVNAVRRSLVMTTEPYSAKKGIVEIVFSWRQTFIRIHPNDVSKIEAIAGMTGIDPTIS